MSDFVSRDEVYIAIALTDFVSDPNYADGKVLLYEEDLKHRIDELPSARLDVNDSGLVSRRDVINSIEETDWYHINKKGEMVKGSPSEMEAWYKYADIMDAVVSVPSAQPDAEKYEYHYDHTDCIWYRPEARNRCPVTCAQYRDGWNDAMNYIFRDGKGYRPFRRDKKYEE